MTSYQRSGIDSIEPANRVLQLLTREPTQEVADRANAAHEHISVHPRLQTGREISESPIRKRHHCWSELLWGGKPHIIHVCKLKTKCKGSQSNTAGCVCERNKFCSGYLVFTDLTSHQLCRLSVVAAEHILQTQPETEWKVKHAQRKPQSAATFPNVFYKHTPVDTWPTERLSLLLKPLHKADVGRRTARLRTCRRWRHRRDAGAGAAGMGLRRPPPQRGNIGWNTDCCVGS